MLNAIPAGPRRPARPAPAPAPRSAGLGASLLVLTGVIVLLLALPLNHVRSNSSPDRLSEHAAAVLTDPEIQSALAAETTTRITNRVVDDSGMSRRAVRDAVRPRVEQLVASERFAAVWQEAARVAATRVLDPNVPYVAVTIGDLASLTAEVAEPFPAAIARPLEQAGPIAVVHLDRTPTQQRGLETLEWLNGLAVPLLTVGIVALLLAIAVSRNRRRTVIAIGTASIVVSLLLLGLQFVIHAALIDAADPGRARDVAEIVWNELMGGFRTQNVVGVVLGVLMIGGALAVRRPRRPPGSEPRRPREARPAGGRPAHGSAPRSRA